LFLGADYKCAYLLTYLLKFLQKRFPPTFSMVHLLHRLYEVDAPGVIVIVIVIIAGPKAPVRFSIR